MKFKIELLDKTIIYANNICISVALQSLGIWGLGQEIDSFDLSDVRYIWALNNDDPASNILICL